MIKNNQQRDSIKQFILNYRAAIKAKLSREQFSILLNVKPDSLRRRRLSILREIGLDLPQLECDADVITQEKLDKFNQALLDLSPKSQNSKISFSNNKQIYVITSAQNATPIHEGFFSSILNYCQERNAQLLVIPYRYKNPTSIWNQNNDADEWWNSSITPYLCEEDLRLANKLRVMGHISIQPTADNPVSGFDSYTGLDSAIFGHPKIQQKTVPAPSQLLPKLLLTTGAITLSNYTNSKAGHKGDFHHSLAATIVEIEKSGIFHVRHIHADEITGNFYDLDKLYLSDGVIENQRVAAIVYGDIHAEYIDKNVENATYHNKDSMANTLNPENDVYHDLTDFGYRNHHNKHNDLLNYISHHHNKNNVEDGLQCAADFLDRTHRNDVTRIIVRANHNEAFDRWLIEAEPKNDPENARFYHYMKYHQYKNTKPTITGFESIDPLEFWCHYPDQQTGLKIKDNVIFLKRDESFIVNDVEIGFHGDIGANGARGSAKSFARTSLKTIIGHSHSPCIEEGCYQVGTSSRLDLSYKKGLSSWMHTHCIIYPDGKRTLINIIDGKWKL